MATSELITFRPQNEFIVDFDEIRDWCARPDSRTTFTGVINAFLPAINYAIRNNIEIIDGMRYVLANFGHVHLAIDHPIRATLHKHAAQAVKKRGPRRVL